MQYFEQEEQEILINGILFRNFETKYVVGAVLPASANTVIILAYF